LQHGFERFALPGAEVGVLREVRLQRGIQVDQWRTSYSGAAAEAKGTGNPVSPAPQSAVGVSTRVQGAGLPGLYPSAAGRTHGDSLA